MDHFNFPTAVPSQIKRVKMVKGRKTFDVAYITNDLAVMHEPSVSTADRLGDNTLRRRVIVFYSTHHENAGVYGKRKQIN